jgi:hypothetical protein
MALEFNSNGALGPARCASCGRNIHAFSGDLEYPSGWTHAHATPDIVAPGEKVSKEELIARHNKADIEDQEADEDHEPSPRDGRSVEQHLAAMDLNAYEKYGSSMVMNPQLKYNEILGRPDLDDRGNLGHQFKPFKKRPNTYGPPNRGN